ncbi:hypothetical protein Cal6303_4460 [Calothrix sp. PCC 6303]|nr:hypothetical protein Cal6303_4460 [Calothrix sp. PCC 6303]
MVFGFCFLWVPRKIFNFPQEIAWESQMVGGFARMLLLSAIAVWVLSALHLFSWLTLVLFYFGCFLLLWWYRERENAENYVSKIYQYIFGGVLDALEQGFSIDIPKTVSRIYEIVKKQLFISKQTIYNTNPKTVLGVLAVAIILTFAVLLRFEHPLLEVRLGTADGYGNVLVTRQLLNGDWAKQIRSLPIFSTLATVISLLGAIDAMHVVRFLAPIIGLLLVLSVGYGIHKLSRHDAGALAGMFSLGAYLYTSNLQTANIPDNTRKLFSDWWWQWLFTITDSLNSSLIQQWAGGNLEIGAMFLMLGLARTWDASRGKHRRVAWVDAFCCWTIVAIASPNLLMIAVAGGILLWVDGKLALSVCAIAWMILASLFAIPENPLILDRSFLLTLPVGLSLLAGLLIIFASYCLYPLLRKSSSIVCIVLFFAIAINFLLPISPKISHLEYDMSARKTLELRMQFPLKSWMVVAPIEQLAASYGAGWYEDLGLFVEKYADKVEKDNFKFPYAVEHLFILVEKRPFVSSKTDISGLPYSVLSDHTYHYYRSSTGRASLQFQALNLCENYRRHHNQDVSIYYEDDNLRFYHFQLDKKLKHQVGT